QLLRVPHRLEELSTGPGSAADPDHRIGSALGHALPPPLSGRARPQIQKVSDCGWVCGSSRMPSATRGIRGTVPGEEETHYGPDNNPDHCRDRNGPGRRRMVLAWPGLTGRHSIGTVT